MMPSLTSGKTVWPAHPQLQPLDWLTAPWDNLQLDACGEMHNIPHHLRCLIVAYDFKWPEVAPMGSVISGTVISFLDQLYAHWVLT